MDGKVDEVVNPLISFSREFVLGLPDARVFGLKNELWGPRLGHLSCFFRVGLVVLGLMSIHIPRSMI